MALPRRSRGLLRLLGVLALALAAGAQFPKKEKVKAPAVKSDVKCVAAAWRCASSALITRCRRYIRCGVCQELAKNLARELKELREAKGAKARGRRTQSRRGSCLTRGGSGVADAPRARRS